MKRILLVTVALAILAGCGADGEPVQPSLNLGIGIGASGITPSLGIGLSQGPVSVGIGL